MGKSKLTLEERFWAKVFKESEGCWHWTASTWKDGYGRFWSTDEGRVVRAHRFAYELANGPIPDGLVIDHLCRNRLCVRADHLEAVTSLENRRRGTNPTAINRLRTECVKGHPFTEDNIRIHPTNGGRNCRACDSVRNRERRLAIAKGERK